MKKKKCPKCGYESKRDAEYCGLCYEPFNKKPAAGEPSPARPPEFPPHSEPAAAPLPPLLKAVFLLLGLAAVGFLLPSLPPMHPGAFSAGPVNHFQAKTDAAEQLLAGLARDRETLLADIAAAPPDPEGFGLDGKYTARMVKLEEDYAAGINALGLPCPTCVDEKKDAAYLAWTADFARRENEASQNFSGRYQQHIQTALSGK
ncbi:MAG: hypothetical protein A2X32_00550 [Elusimicrobia bacterium GWC2_64_44]|nr:MAG: hypothetical protein A2X32_00550 [Elusimicrobia bacterium GWC2_64_44]